MPKYIVPNVAKACRVLELLGESAEGLSAADVETGAAMPRTTAFRVMKTLVAQGFAETRGKRFYPGPALIRCGLKALSSLALRQRAVPILQALSHDVGETSHLAVLSGNRSLIVEVCDSPLPVRVASRPGTLVEPYCSAHGKVMMAFMDKATRDAMVAGLVLQRRTPRTLVSRDALLAELDSIRRRGYGIDDEEFHEGVRCVAAPVRDAAGAVVAAIGVTGSTATMAKRGLKPKIERVISAGEALSAANA